jgi:hypothetical protein
MESWSEERAKAIEEQLIGLVRPLNTVVEPHGCSYERYRDAKITFGHTSARKLAGFYLEYNPDNLKLTAWGSGIRDEMPEDLMAFISTQFPHANLRDNMKILPSHRPQYANFPFWYPITAEELLQASTPPPTNP